MPRTWPALRRRVLLAATWLVGGAVATSVGFGAVLLVGDEVTTQSAAPLSRQAVEAALAARSATGTPAASLPRTTASTGTIEDPTTMPSLSPTRAPTQPGSPTRTRSPRPRDTATPPDPSTPAGTTTPPNTRLGSYQLKGGHVVVACTGAVITLRYAVPADGYRSEVQSSPTQIEAEFEGLGRHSHVSVTCRNGEPVGRVEEEAEGEPGHFTGTTVPR